MYLFLISFIVWAVVHSLTAALGMKRWFHRRFGQKAYVGLYRLLYNIFSLVTFVPVLYFSWRLLPSETVWEISMPWNFLLLTLQLAGVLGLIVSLLQTDVLDFVGLRGALWYLGGAQGEIPVPQFVTGGMYALVRHPLYLFSLMLLWFNPIMTAGGLIFNGMVTLYFWIGSIYEEKKLAVEYGAAYAAYCRRVPRLVPVPWRYRREA